MKKLLTVLVLGSLTLTSCGTMGVVSSPSQYDAGGKEVTAVAKNTNILGLNAMDAQKKSTELLKELNGKCTSGVKNIRTTSSVNGIFIFAFEKLEMTGNCK